MIMGKRLSSALMILLLLLSGCAARSVQTGDEIAAATDSGEAALTETTDNPENGRTADDYYAVYRSSFRETLPPVLVTNSSMDAPRDHGSEFGLVFEGDWDRIDDPAYQRRLENLFYAVYPKIYARWGTGTEPKTIHFHAESEYDGVAASWENNIEVSTEYANEAPLDIGYFVHELTHNVQSYNGMDWWCENLASYAGFRYFHWSYADAVKLPDPCSEEIHDWAFTPYGECMLFYSYLDEMYPTREGASGGRIPGLLDAVHFAVKDGSITEEGDPDDPDTPFNRVVKSVTGVPTIEELRRRFLSDLDSRKWIFKGFKDMPDLFVTDGVGDAMTDYPTLDLRMPVSGSAYDSSEPQYTTPEPYDSSRVRDESAGPDSVALERSVFRGAKVVRSSGFIHEGEQDAFLTDGDSATKWCAEAGNVRDKAFAADGVEHFVVLDLGEERVFNTYSIYNGGSREISDYNASCWELMVSQDGENFYSLDFIKNVGFDVVTRTVSPVAARFVMLRVYRADNGSGTVRLYEMAAEYR